MLVDKLGQITVTKFSFLLARFQYGLEKVQTTNKYLDLCGGGHNTHEEYLVVKIIVVRISRSLVQVQVGALYHDCTGNLVLKLLPPHVVRHR